MTPSPKEALEKNKEVISCMSLSPSQLRDLQSIFGKKISYVPHNYFCCSFLIQPVMEQEISVSSGRMLHPDEERVLFIQMNYARYNIYQIRKKLVRRSRWQSNLVWELLGWHQKYLETRNKIVTCNIGLVLSLAKNATYAEVEHADLVSEGNMALLRAVHAFDCSRGYKFSSCACRVILRSFSRLVYQNIRYRRFFTLQLNPSQEKQEHSSHSEQEPQYWQADEVLSLLTDRSLNLSNVEQLVVEKRYNLGNNLEEPLTLRELSERLGMSKERIRQIQNNALAKLRQVVNRRLLDGSFFIKS